MSTPLVRYMNLCKLEIKALNELIRHIKQNNPSCKRLCLTVHPENEAGRLFYLKFGFSEDNILTFDEPTFSIFI